MRLKVLGAFSAALVLFAVGLAVAQAPAWAVGTWRGTLEAYRNDPWGAERVMIIEPSGRCRWFHASKAESTGLAKSCNIGADTIELQTVAHSTVKLKYSDGKLRGQFITSAGKTHSITLSK